MYWLKSQTATQSRSSKFYFTGWRLKEKNLHNAPFLLHSETYAILHPSGDPSCTKGLCCILCLRLTPTIVCAALQQQSIFIQLTEFPHADEIVVHSRNLSFPRLPSGACETKTLSDIASLTECAIFLLKGWVGELEVTPHPTSPQGRDLIPNTAGL